MNSITRRQFLEDSILAAAAAAAIPAPLRAAEHRAASANDKITAAIIGCGIRGKQHADELAKLPDCEIAYVCDPDRDRAAEVAAHLVTKNRPQPKAVQDLRVILEDKSVAAVFIATPNHWHSLMAIWAMQAGKDVYVEKPVSHNVSEGRSAVEASRKYKRICQVGTQCRSNPGMQQFMQYVQSGKIGNVKVGRGLCYKRRPSIGEKGEYPVPAEVNYNLWSGPAPILPVTRPKFHYDWHWSWAYGNGDLGNQGIHQMDLARWCLGVNELCKATFSYGGRLSYEDENGNPVEDAGESANTQVVVHDYGNKT